MIPESSRFPSSSCWIQRVQEPGSGPEEWLLVTAHQRFSGLLTAPQRDGTPLAGEMLTVPGLGYQARVMHASSLWWALADPYRRRRLPKMMWIRLGDKPMPADMAVARRALDLAVESEFVGDVTQVLEVVEDIFAA